MNDTEYMRMALDLAQKGCGFTAPNPMVGAVVVKDGRVIGQGFHETYGQPHAERNALASCTESPKGAVMYVTLEPCCHYGKQPPCVNAVIEAGIGKVVIGSADPNPLVSGKGVQILREHGVQVTENVLREECDRLNEVFFYSNGSAVRSDEICDDDGWKNSGLYRRFQMDYRRGCQKSCATAAPSIYSDYGWDRNGAGR